ncbi:MAG: exodeoxyribonuclease V subunit alpha [Desulfobacterales bacterium]
MSHMDTCLIDHLYQNRRITYLDVQFALFLARVAPGTDPDVPATAALAGSAAEKKHVCIHLSEAAEILSSIHRNEHEDMPRSYVPMLRQKLLASPLVGEPGDRRPLILDDNDRIYLYRYWRCETRLAERLCERFDAPLLNVNTALLHESLNRYFPSNTGPENNLYQRALITACFKPICIITGGPGTGKTTTVVKILLSLMDQRPDFDLRILMAAPTGKSAARLGESIRNALTHVAGRRTGKAAFPRPQTLHRLLAPVKGSSSVFTYGSERPLSADIVVLDEASMVDLSMMSKFMDAVPKNARLILVGDPYQLASVEAGSAFGDMCTACTGRYTSQWDALVQAVIQKDFEPTRIQRVKYGKSADSVVRLDSGFRFAESPGIDTLNRAVVRGDSKEAFRLFSDSAFPEIRFENAGSRQKLNEILERNVITGYRDYLTEETPAAALEKLNSFKILCALRKGEFGVERINRFAEWILSKHGLIRLDDPWYAGRPILITKNDYRQELFNGDLGILWNVDGNINMACFPSEDGSIRYISPYRLPRHKTAYAVTVHKSQGSEFSSVLLVLPKNDTALLTRELLYTGMSRAARELTVCGVKAIFNTAVSRVIHRNSGLADAVRKGSG